MNSSATCRINYTYKYDDNIYWSITSYVDNLGFIVPIYATNYSYGIR